MARSAAADSLVRRDVPTNAVPILPSDILVVWRNPSSSLDCRILGPFSPCFCGHSLQRHVVSASTVGPSTTAKTKNEPHFSWRCEMNGCKCVDYDHVPLHGAQIAHCVCHSCKHPMLEHNANTNKKTSKKAANESALRRYPCSRASCRCSAFISSLLCDCGGSWSDHLTLTRLRSSLAPVNDESALPTAAWGGNAPAGLNSFSALLHGVDRQLNSVEDSEQEHRQQGQRQQECNWTLAAQLFFQPHTLAIRNSSLVNTAATTYTAAPAMATRKARQLEPSVADLAADSAAEKALRKETTSSTDECAPRVLVASQRRKRDVNAKR